MSSDILEYERLSDEMERELHYCQTLNWSNSVLEQSIEDMKMELCRMEDSDYPIDEEALEWKARYDSQVILNRQLEQQRHCLRRQYDHIRRQFRDAYMIDTMYPEYEKYTELELARMLRQLERKKQDLGSEVKNLNYQIDKESKEFHHYDELRRTYRADIGITDRDLQQLNNVRMVMEQQVASSPLATPAARNYLDGIECNSEHQGDNSNHREFGRGAERSMTLAKTDAATGGTRHNNNNNCHRGHRGHRGHGGGDSAGVFNSAHHVGGNQRRRGAHRNMH